jgi:predicted dehydrogenase
MSVMPDGDRPLRVGLVGAGPWAQFVHGPMFAGHPATDLVGVWARRREAATELAAAQGTKACPSFEALLEVCDAVSFAVPPDVQSELAQAAARAGKTLLLEKPVALDVEAAQRLADEVDDAGVGTQVVLTWRYTMAVRSFLVSARALGPVGGRAHFISGGAQSGPFSTPWRRQHGMLLDLGPHVVDLLEAALGRVVGVRAHGDVHRWVGLLLEHESGVVSEASLCATSNVDPFRAGAEIYGEPGGIEIDTGLAAGPSTMQTIVDEFVATANGQPHPLDVHHGLHLQRVLADALADLAAGR